MAFWKRANRADATAQSASSKGGAAPRRVERYVAKPGLKTTLGRAIDLSAAGARLHSDQKPSVAAQAALPLEIFFPTGSEQVNARVCWIRRKGICKPHWEMGVKFIAVSVEQQNRLLAIAEKGFLPAREQRAEAPPTRTGPDAAMLALQSHFEELGLGVEATHDQVRAAHRRLVRHCHPDVASGEDAKATFLRLQDSYQQLVDAFRERDREHGAAA